MIALTRRGQPDLLVYRLLPAALVAAGVVFGAGVAAVAAPFGALAPVIVLAIPLLPAVALAILSRPWIGVVAVIAVLPVGTSKLPGVPMQVVQVVVLISAVIVVLRRLGAGVSPLPWSRELWWIVAFIGWALLAMPSSADQQRALREVVLWIDAVVLVCVVMAVMRSVEDVRRILTALAMVVAGVAIATVAQGAHFQTTVTGAVQGRATGIFVEPNQFGTFSTIGALVGIGLTLSATTQRSRVLFGLLALLPLWGLYLSLSRGAWIGFSLGLSVLVVKLPEARRALVGVGLPLILVATLFGTFAPSSPQVEIVGQRLKSINGEKSPYDDRPSIWAEARREILLDPITGQGPGSFPIASTRGTSKSRTAFAEHAHDQILTWAAEDGLPAAGLMIAFGWVLARRSRTRRRPGAPRQLAVLSAALVAALTAVIGQGLVDYTLRNTVVVSMIFCVIGCLLALSRLSGDTVTDTPIRT